MSTQPDMSMSNSGRRASRVKIGETDHNDDAQSNHSGSLFFASTAVTNVSAPFVCRLAHRCIVVDQLVNDARFVKYDVDSAVAFIDISGYSGMAEALASKGAHALAAAVNGYFKPMLDIVAQRGGHVLKFAGDALMTAWTEDTIEASALAAVRCAVELQDKCGVHSVPGTDRQLRIHIGITAGELETNVFRPKTGAANVMQPAFYYVGGGPLREIGDVVDAAPKGSVGVTQHVAKLCGAEVTTEPFPNDASGALKVLSATPFPEVESDVEELSDLDETDFGASMLSGTMSFRAGTGQSGSVDDFFVPPAVLAKLRMGLRIHDMAEMRLLYVLFLKKTGLSDVNEWFDEVHDVLASNRCPITQIIDDDKGTHVVAAMNLYVGEDGAADAAVNVVRELAEREVGCIIGIAGGSCFCGIVGSEEICRWDVTGWACVRACRMMQYAEKEGITAAIDQTVTEAVKDKSVLSMYCPEVTLKGAPEPVPAFTLSDTSTANIGAICAINEYCSKVYEDERVDLVEAIIDQTARVGTTPSRDMTASPRSQGIDESSASAPARGRAGKVRSALANQLCSGAVVVGFCQAGKKTLILSALASDPSFVPLMHRTVRGSPRLHLCNTIAAWFSYSPIAELRTAADRLHKAYSQGHLAHSLELAVTLLIDAVKRGAKTAVIVDRAQYLDDASLRLVGVLLRHLSPEANPDCSGYPGRILFFFVLTPQLGGQSVGKISSLLEVNLPVLRLSGVGSAAASAMHQGFSMYNLQDHAAEAVCRAVSGMPGSVMPVMQWIGPRAFKSYMMFRRGAIPESECFAYVTSDLRCSWDVFCLQLLRAKSREINPDLMHRLAQFCDVLHPRQQTLLKVVACLDVNEYAVPCDVAAEIAVGFLRSVTRDMMLRHLDTLKELMLVDFVEAPATTGERPPRKCRLATRSLRELILETLTPAQVAGVSNRALHELEKARYVSDGNVHYHLVVAQLAHRAQQQQKAESFLQVAWKFASTDALKRDVMYAIEDCSVTATDIAVGGVVPAFPAFTVFPKSGAAAMELEQAKNFEPPLVLGPLGGHVARLAPHFLLMQARVVHKVDTHSIPWIPPPFEPEPYLALIDIFESVTPLYRDEATKTSTTADEEREMIQRWAMDCADQGVIDANVKQFMQYTDAVVRPRARRVTRFAASIKDLVVTWAPAADGEDAEVVAAREQRRAALLAAFQLLRPVDNDGPADTPSLVRHALMALAVRSWSSPYPYMTVAKLRDSWLFGWISPVELKAIVLLFLMDERPARLDITSASDWSAQTK